MLAGIFMLPTVKPLLGIFIEQQALRQQLIILLMRQSCAISLSIICCHWISSSSEVSQPFHLLFKTDSGFTKRIRSIKPYSNAPLDQFAQNILLNGTDNGDIGTSDKNGTLRTLAVGNRGLCIEH